MPAGTGILSGTGLHYFDEDLPGKNDCLKALHWLHRTAAIHQDLPIIP